MSNFGNLMKRLRKEQGLTLEAVAKKIGSHKGYVSGIENDQVNPPSVKFIRKIAKLFHQDEKMLVRIAWADKAPALIREDAHRALAHTELEGADPVPTIRIPLLCTLESGYAADLNPDGSVKPAVSAMLTLPRFAGGLDAAAAVCDDSMEDSRGTGLARGDVVLLRRAQKLPAGAAVYIVFTARQKRQALIRQVVPEQGDHIVLQPLNKGHALAFLTQDDIDTVYRVVGKIAMFAMATSEARA